MNVACDGPERVNLMDEIHICAIRAYRDVFTASLRSIRYYRHTGFVSNLGILYAAYLVSGIFNA
ncbi:hypothetical protein SOASR014_30210 [Pectobacterium carotovorum subsp. carotovorum]|nr:hypothetical protein SOASR014_30210 [Pectobacterium carotovorum subsp. carotovorum]GLX43141.1 hypothetical protein Pcaca01_08090 [Pectobacterium carotovorum subsp. carotovorum]